MISKAQTADEPLGPTLKADILSCYGALCKLSSLDPSPQVNALFGELVGLCRQTPNEVTTDMILKDPGIIEIVPHLRQICGDGEFRLEAYWAEKILQFDKQEDVTAMLLKFTYYDNYVNLVRMELNAISSVTLDEQEGPLQLAVLGSGPLPLTSLCILETLNKQKNQSVCIHNIDHNPWAISTSTKLCRRLGHSPNTMCFHCVDVKSPSLDLYAFDVVYLAALVGTSREQKHDLVLDLVSRMRPGALLMLRSAHSLRGLMYPVRL